MDANNRDPSSKRTTLTIDPDVKLVFNYSLFKHPSKNTSDHLRNLLKNQFGETDWDQLIGDASEHFRRCLIHDKPFIQMCKTCEIALCEDCDILEHDGHVIEYYCARHEVSYERQCYLCEKESWETKVRVEGITCDELASEVKLNQELVIVDVRGKKQSKTIENAHQIPYHNFRKETDVHKELLELVKNNPDATWITFSQGRQGHPLESMRGWLATLDLKVKFRVKQAFYLKGGFINFVETYPEHCIQKKSE
jgi:hypothetical protein